MSARAVGPGRPLPAWLRDLKRLADQHGWDSLSYRQLGAGDGYLFIRGVVEVDIRADHAGRIGRAIRTSPSRPPTDPRRGRGQAAKAWLTESPSAAVGEIIRFTRVHRSITTGYDLVTYDACLHCGGRINNNALTRRHGDTDKWVHVYREDWENNVHPAVPVGGPVTDTDQPSPWLIAGDPRTRPATNETSSAGR